MKKIMFMLIALVALTTNSCSKESRINRKLDGDWKAESYEGESMYDGESFTISFSKDKKGKGTGSSSYTTPTFVSNTTFTYSLSQNKLTITPTSGIGTDKETFVLTTFKRDKIVWTDYDYQKTVLVPN